MPFNFGLKYSKCTADELRSFVKERTGRDAEPKKPHDVYVRILNQLDEEMSLEGFISLPEELRIEIYKELLTYDKALGRVAYLEILRVSKEIYGEALKVLHKQSKITVYARCPFGNSYWTVHGGNRTYEETLSLCDGDAYAHNLHTWMHHFKSVRNMDLHFRGILQPFSNYGLERSRPKDPRWTVAIHLFDGLVAQCKSLRRLKVTFVHDIHPRNMHGGVGDLGQHLTEEDQRIVVVDALAPLRGLSEECVVDLRGLDEETAKRVWEKIREEEKKDAVLREWLVERIELD